MSKKIVSIIIVFALVAILFNIRISTLYDTSELQLSHASSLINLDISWPPQRLTIPIKLKWIFATGHNVLSSPVLGDINGNSQLEVVVGSSDHKIYVLNGGDGTQIWGRKVNFVWRSSLALWDIDNDGKLEIVACFLGNYSETEEISPPKLYVFHGEKGAEVWNQTIGSTWESSPVVGDIDGDGGFEVVIGCSQRFDYYGKLIESATVYAFDGKNGTIQWKAILSGGTKTSPALGDIDDDGKLEVVVGSSDHKIYALNGGNGTQLWNFTTGGPVFSSPVLGDIDGYGKLEIVIGSYDKKIYAINGEDGTQLWNFTTGGYIESSPALGDVDGDGKLEVIVGSEDHKIYALNGGNGTQLWNFTTGGPVYSSPALADVDGDDKLEVVVGSNDKKIYVLNGEDGNELWSYTTGGAVWSSPVIGDIDDDGKLEIVIGSCDHNVYAFDTICSTYNEDNKFLLISIGVIVTLLVTCALVIRFYFFKKRDLEKGRKR